MALTIKRSIFLLLLVNFTATVFAQTTPTATQIVQRAIDSSGGDAKFEALNSVEFYNKLITPARDTLSMAVKRKDFNKFFISTISSKHVNSTTIYNNGKAIIIENEAIQNITDPRKLEELAFQCYMSVSYAYKMLKYKLTRIEDEKIRSFDCYVVIAESPLGKRTANYYDKKTGHLLMIIYSTKNKTLFVKNAYKNGVMLPGTVWLTDSLANTTLAELESLEFDKNIDNGWFNILKAGPYKIPENIRTGSFKYLRHNEGTVTKRGTDSQVETTKGSNEVFEYKIKWLSGSEYLMYAPKNPKLNYNIRVKIVNWGPNKYFCHYDAAGAKSGSCEFEILP
jgi:hypothetical protein